MEGNEHVTLNVNLKPMVIKIIGALRTVEVRGPDGTVRHTGLKVGSSYRLPNKIVIVDINDNAIAVSAAELFALLQQADPTHEYSAKPRKRPSNGHRKAGCKGFSRPLAIPRMR